MNNTILTLEKRRARVLKLRQHYMWNCDKEQEHFNSTLNRFDRVLDNIVKRIKSEWNKLYRNEKKDCKNFKQQ